MGSYGNSPGLFHFRMLEPALLYVHVTTYNTVFHFNTKIVQFVLTLTLITINSFNHVSSGGCGALHLYFLGVRHIYRTDGALFTFSARVIVRLLLHVCVDVVWVGVCV